MIGVNKHKKKVKGKGMCDRHATGAFGVSNAPSAQAEHVVPPRSVRSGGRTWKEETHLGNRDLARVHLKKRRRHGKRVFFYIIPFIISTYIDVYHFLGQNNLQTHLLRGCGMMRDDVLHMQMQPVCSAWFASMLGTVQPPQRPSSQLPHHLGPYKTSVRRGALLYGQLHRGLGTEPVISVGPYYKGALFSSFLP